MRPTVNIFYHVTANCKRLHRHRRGGITTCFRVIECYTLFTLLNVTQYSVANLSQIANIARIALAEGAIY